MYSKVVLLYVGVILQNICQCQARTKKGSLRKQSNVLLWNNLTGEFTTLNGENGTRDVYKYAERMLYAFHPLENSTVRVIADDMDPYIKIHNSELSGYLGELWHILEDLLRFKTDFHQMEYMDGLMAMENNKADVFLAVGVYKSTLKSIYFSHPYFNNWYHLYFPTPDGKPPQYVHFTVFTTDAWTKIALFLLLHTLVLWLTCNALQIILKGTERVLSLPTYFLGVMSAFVNTGHDLQLRSYSARIQILFALLFGNFCYSALNASLVARLAVLDKIPPFNDIYDISETTTHILCVRNSSFVYNNFTDENQIKLPRWRKVLNTNECPDMLKWKDIPKVICNKKFLVLENRILMSMVMHERLPCSVEYLPQKYFPAGNVFLMNTNFKGIKIINKSINLLRSVGIMDKIEANWIKNPLSGTAKSVYQRTSEITFSHIQGLISIYCYLILGVLLILILEIIHSKCFEENDKKKKSVKKSSKENITTVSFNGHLWYIK